VGDKLEFWKGVTVGLLAGMVAAAFARTATKSLPAGDGRGELIKPPPPAKEIPPRKEPLEFRLKRDDPENAGDPAQLSPDGVQGRFAEFERTGGEPGGGAHAERIEVPSRPGEEMQHADISASVEVASRSLNLNGGQPRYQRLRQDWSS
jgi:hypothetical protein